MHTRPSVLTLLAAGICSVVLANAAARQVVVVAALQRGRLQAADCGGVAVPRHHVGCYVEWTNEHEFLANQWLAEHAPYQITANVARVEVRRFPEGWGKRSGQYYSTYYLQAVSAKGVEGR